MSQEDFLLKWEDAHDAGTENAALCTLILTNGDSATTFAMEGLSVVGREQYGVLQLHDKQSCSDKTMQKQDLDFNSLVKVVNLKYDMKYGTLELVRTSLRYGKLLILADQNEDGSNFKGVLINFLHSNWPELLCFPFLEVFMTPVVQATKKKTKVWFYSPSEFQKWQTATWDSKEYGIKYYRGLGTCTSNEAKKYFRNMQNHRVVFVYSGTKDDRKIINAFGQQRSEWLTYHLNDYIRLKSLGLEEKYLYTKDTKAITYSEFIDVEYVRYASYDNERSIPSAVDGLKPAERKILYTCIKRNDKREIKINQLASSVAEQSAYHQDEASLCALIVKMSQNFIGTNNINLLIPFGQFGTRLAGGNDRASFYYLSTSMSPFTRLIFHPDDDALLTYNYDVDQKIEPKWFIPIIPMILVNGCEGVGTGWSTFVPNYDPRELIHCLRKMMAGEEPALLIPYYKNFLGTINVIRDTSFLTIGCVAIIEDSKIEITELPINTWTTTYRDNVLEPLLHSTDNAKRVIRDYEEYLTDTTVRFVISFVPREFEKLQKEIGGFHRVFKLCKNVSTNNMHAFDHNNFLRKYPNANKILKEFYDIRLEYYVKRKEYLQSKLTAEADKLSDQLRFITEICNDTIVVKGVKSHILIHTLIERGYRPDPVEKWKLAVEKETGEYHEIREDSIHQQAFSLNQNKFPVSLEKILQNLADFKQFDYLVGMPIWMMTKEMKDELLIQRTTKLFELNILQRKSKYDLWLNDLEMLERKLNDEEKEQLNVAKNMKIADELLPSVDGVKVEIPMEILDR